MLRSLEPRCFLRPSPEQSQQRPNLHPSLEPSSSLLLSLKLPTSLRPSQSGAVPKSQSSFQPGAVWPEPTLREKDNRVIPDPPGKTVNYQMYHLFTLPRDRRSLIRGGRPPDRRLCRTAVRGLGSSTRYEVSSFGLVICDTSLKLASLVTFSLSVEPHLSLGAADFPPSEPKQLS